jgi:hypothetical protein
MCQIASLYPGQVAVANENLFSTSLPGKIKVKSNKTCMKTVDGNMVIVPKWDF